VYLAPATSGWVDTRQMPAAATATWVTELPYWTIVRELTGESATAQSELDPDGGFLSVGVVRPSGAAINYAVLTRQGTAPYARVGTGDFAPSCVLANAIGQTQTLLNVLDGVDLDLVALDTYAQVGGELLAIRAVNRNAGTITVDRGLLDTVPTTHAAGARIYFVRSITRFASMERVGRCAIPRWGSQSSGQRMANETRSVQWLHCRAQIWA